MKRASFDWTFWLTWVLLTTLAWVVGQILPSYMTVAIGALVGIVQWVVLRSLFPQAAWWILASALGWAASHILLSAALAVGDVTLSGAITGVTLGTAQWLALRRWVYLAGWWVVISTLGWAAGPVLGASLTGAVVGATTGLALELLRRHPR